MEEKKKENEFKENYKRTKNLYNALKEDEESVLFASEQLTNQLIKKVKKSNYEKDNIFLKLYNKIENVNVLPFLGKSAASGAIGLGASSLLGKIFGGKLRKRKRKRGKKIRRYVR